MNMSEETPQIQSEPVAVEPAVPGQSNQAVNELIGQEIHFENGAAVMVQAIDMNLTNGACLLGITQGLHLTQGGAGVVMAQSATLDESSAGLLVARQVQAEQIETKVLLAGTVTGDVQTAIDTPRALLFGLAAGVGAGVTLLLGSLIFRRR